MTKTITSPSPQLRDIFENAAYFAGQRLHQVELPLVQILFDLAQKFALETVSNAPTLEGSLILVDCEASDLNFSLCVFVHPYSRMARPDNITIKHAQW